MLNLATAAMRREGGRPQEPGELLEVTFRAPYEQAHRLSIWPLGDEASSMGFLML